MNENGQQTAFFMVTAEQLREVAEKAAEKVAARIEAEKNDRLLTTAQAALVLNVNKTTLWRWGKQGLLHPVHIGGKIMYKASELQDRGAIL